MITIGIYKTNVDNRLKAERILDEIRRKFPGSDPSIDLNDCDKVLRIECETAVIKKQKIENILENYGYTMEILP